MILLPLPKKGWSKVTSFAPSGGFAPEGAKSVEGAKPGGSKIRLTRACNASACTAHAVLMRTAPGPARKARPLPVKRKAQPGLAAGAAGSSSVPMQLGLARSSRAPLVTSPSAEGLAVQKARSFSRRSPSVVVNLLLASMVRLHVGHRGAGRSLVACCVRAHPLFMSVFFFVNPSDN